MRGKREAEVPRSHFISGVSASQTAFALVLILRLRTTSIYNITHIVEYQGRKGTHALPLFGTKCFVKWLPRLGEFIQIG